MALQLLWKLIPHYRLEILLSLFVINLILISVIIHNFLFLINNFLMLHFNLLWQHLISNNFPAIMTQPLIINIQKLFVNHANLPVRNTEALSIDKTLNGSHLIQQNNIIIFYLKVNCIQVTMKKFVF